MYKNGLPTCLDQKVFPGPKAIPSLNTALLTTPGKLIRCGVKLVPLVVSKRKMFVPVPFNEEVPMMNCVLVPGAANVHRLAYAFAACAN